ncbi:hypothetical protein F4824DRAFT_471454 [Ustulina deusta]|nr:hypothetical protein F4824DRAFT_471454 [Ustulina deusta]
MASIRLRRDEDLAACVEITKAVYHHSGYPVGGVENALDELRTDDQAWVAEDSGAIVGHVAMNNAPETYVNVALWLERDPQANVAVLARLFRAPGKTWPRHCHQAHTDCRGRSAQQGTAAAPHPRARQGPGCDSPVSPPGLGALCDHAFSLGPGERDGCRVLCKPASVTVVAVESIVASNGLCRTGSCGFAAGWEPSVKKEVDIIG